VAILKNHQRTAFPIRNTQKESHHDMMAPNIPQDMTSPSGGSYRASYTPSFRDDDYDEEMPQLEDMDAHNSKKIDEENHRVESANQTSIPRVSFAPTISIVVETVPTRNRDVFWLTEDEIKLHKQQAIFSCKEFRKSYSNEGLKALQQIWPKIATECISFDSDEEIAQRLWKVRIWSALLYAVSVGL
jgi:hypothetical protein